MAKSQTSPILSVIIVSYNTRDLTLQTLESLWQDIKSTSQLKKPAVTEIILVDNNSHDDTIKAVKTWQRQHNVPLEIISNSRNSGFAAANNQGIKKSQGEHIFLLNSDTQVQPGCLAALLAVFEKNPINDLTAASQGANLNFDRVGIVAALLLNPDGSVQAQGGSFPTLISLASHMLMLDDLPILGKFLPSTQHTGHNQQATKQKLSSDIKAQDWVGATAVMIRRQLLNEIGDLDEAIFMYGEDVELCMRARHHHWDVLIQPRAQVIHIGSASSSPANALAGELKTYHYIWAKHYPLWQQLPALWLLKLGCLLRWFIFGTMLHNSARAEVYKNCWETL
jgi:GT2 family glycosyltransferase